MKIMLVIAVCLMAVPLWAGDYIIHDMGGTRVIHGPGGYEGIVHDMGGTQVYEDNRGHSGMMHDMGDTSVYTDTTPGRSFSEDEDEGRYVPYLARKARARNHRTDDAEDED